MRLGRTLWENSSVVKAALRQMSEISTSEIMPQFDGQDKEWGQLAEDWLYENDKWIDVRGWPYRMADVDRLIVLSIIRDGDIGELLTEDAEGNPKVQLIPAHRIGSRNGMQERIKSGQFSGYLLIDGVILGDSWDTVGYRVLGSNKDEDRDYSINDMRLHFRPVWTDQIRGYSWLGAAAIDAQDVKESRRLELVAQKVLASRVILEHNETGQADPGHATIISGLEGVEAADSESGQATAPVYGRSLAGGETTYFRAGSNSRLDVVTGDRPTANQQAFSADVIRQAIHGLGWSVDYALDPSKVGGASMRVVVETINDTVSAIRCNIVSPVRHWIDGWRIAKSIKNGRLPFNEDWWKWAYQFSQRKTADKKYDSDVDIAEMRAGVSTLRDVCARRGLWWEEVVEQKEREVMDQFEAAERISKRFGITIEAAIDRLGLLTPNGTTAPSAPAAETNPNPEPAAP
jgi:hypothetical protein